MESTAQSAITYLQPACPDFWRWDEDSVCWDDGSTLTFRPEVLQILGRLQPGGLPPFSAVLMFLAAIRTPDERLKPVGNLMLPHFEDEDSRLLENALPEDWHQHLTRRVNALQRLPLKWRTEPDGKSVLAEVIFEGAPHRGFPEEGQDVVHLLRRRYYSPSPVPGNERGPAYRAFAEAMRAFLHHKPPDITDERLEIRARTGLDALPYHADVPVDAADSARALLAELEKDSELRSLSMVARDLMAAVHIPRCLGDPDHLPLGGFSDISNRGPLDRLLVSELAQDNLTLSVRVALHEALYLRRESPPASPRRTRHILVDNGVRLWGVPRVFAAATVLAIAATSEKGVDLRVYCPVDNGVSSINLSTRDGLVELLGALQPHAHPGDAIRALIDSVPAGDLHDLILVTSASTPRDQALFASLKQAPPECRVFLATVDRSGEFRIVALRNGLTRDVNRAQLDLAALYPAPVSAPPLLKKSPFRDLPAIFHAPEFPFLMPYAPQPLRAVDCGDYGMVAGTGDGRILHLFEPEKGGRQLLDRLDGEVFIAVETPEGKESVAHVLSRYAIPKEQKTPVLLRIDLESGEIGRIPVDVPARNGPFHAIVLHGMLIVLTRTEARIKLAQEGSMPSKRTPLPSPLVQGRGRYSQGFDRTWYAVGFDGTQPVFEPANAVEVPPPAMPRRWPSYHGVNLRNRFKRIGVNALGRLCLVDKSDFSLCFDLAGNRGSLVFRKTRERMTSSVSFSLMEENKERRYRLEWVQWADGSVAILDSRGLLHLRSSRKDLPEMSLVLAEGHPAAWASSGETCGAPYYFTDEATSEASVLFSYLQQFTDSLIAPDSSS